MAACIFFLSEKDFIVQSLLLLCVGRYILKEPVLEDHESSMMPL